jgi:hypothetical protein
MDISLIGIAIEHPKYGWGIISRKDRYGRYSARFMNGCEIGALAENQFDVIPLSKIKSEKVYERFERSGVISFLDRDAYNRFVGNSAIIRKVRPFFEDGRSLDSLKKKLIDIIDPIKIGQSDIRFAIERQPTNTALFSYIYQVEESLADGLQRVSRLLDSVETRMKRW